MSRISRLDRREVTPDLAALFDKAFAQRGNVPNMFRVMAHRPEIFSTMQAHFAAVLEEFVRGVQDPRTVPPWERANLLAKYFITTQAVELARRKRSW